MRVVIQIGYMKTGGRRKDGQRVCAWINDLECSWSDTSGQYVTSRADAAKGILWFLWSGEVSVGDLIRIEAKTYVSGAGPDEGRTFTTFYQASEDLPVKEVILNGVGFRGIPLIKGRVIEVSSVSLRDERESVIEDFLSEDTF